MLIFAQSHQDPGCRALDVLKPLQAHAGDPDEKCVTVVQSGGDKGMSLSPKHLTYAAPPMYSFLILSSLFTPKENLNLLNDAAYSSVFCLFLSATVFKPGDPNSWFTDPQLTLPGSQQERGK